MSSEYMLPSGMLIEDAVAYLLLLADVYPDSPVGNSIRRVAREHKAMRQSPPEDPAMKEIERRFQD